ncbi:hypothetical protein MS3_00004182 [Schistosoma haematobium]|uniref:Uncharacterized protein n=1 Tax=Schistosoma haematobium TaxID=6185 RepID=A0A922LRV5_SCHHA|nr:hypothetical protein MS3_00004182 [Schistosoma haematobium]KAH9592157.1 hypothetical protein MS3_00004182 [Schistosoma haematobium]CAH8675728.1 unnamed protein product [Schistosoma haematobium]
MPRCRKEKKIPYRTDDMVQNVRSSFIREGENNLRNYSEPVDDRMKQVFYRGVPENVMKEQIHGQRFYRGQPTEGQNMNNYMDAYDRMKPSNMYNDMSNKARSYSKWNDYDRSRPIDSYSRNIRDGFEPRNASPYAKNLMGDLPTTRNIRDGFEPRNTSPYSRNLMGDLPTTRNIRDGFEPRNASSYSRNLMGDLPVPRSTHTAHEPRRLSPYASRPNNLMGDLPDVQHNRETYEPHYIPVKLNRSNNLMNNVSEPRTIRDGFEPRNASSYSGNLMGDLPVPSSVSSNGNTYSYSIPQRPNLKIVREEDTFNRYMD